MSSKLKIVSHIKHEVRNGEKKVFFNRVGRAFVNKDGSLNMFLDYLPLPSVDDDGKSEPIVFNIRDHQPKEQRDKEGFNE